jgi:ABC-2 type transport system permease protein
MGLQSLGVLIRMELKKLVRQPAYLFLNLLFPAILTIVFLFAFSDPELGMSVNFFVPGLIAYAIIFVILTVAQSFSSERQEGLLRRLSTTPMTSIEFMGSRIVTHMLISFLQVIIVFTLAFLLGFRPNSGFPGIFYALPVTAIFSLSSVGLGLITATISKTPEVATGLSFIFILPQMFFGTFIPITSTTQQIAKFIPSYYLIDALQKIFEGLINTDILLDLGVISIFSISTVILGVFLFEKYGSA